MKDACVITEEEFTELVKDCINECMNNDKERGASGMMRIVLGVSYAELAAKITTRLFKESEVTEATE